MRPNQERAALDRAEAFIRAARIGLENGEERLARAQLAAAVRQLQTAIGILKRQPKGT
jgi:hypothetical protein